MFLDFILLPIMRWRHERFSRRYQVWPQSKKDLWAAGVLDEMRGADWSGAISVMVKKVREEGVGFREPEVGRSAATEEAIALLSPGQFFQQFHHQPPQSALERLGQAIKNGADGNDIELQRLICLIAPVACLALGDFYPKMICKLITNGMLIRPANATVLLQGFGLEDDVEAFYSKKLETALAASTAPALAHSRLSPRL